jgi:hypothetical protein
MSPIFALDPIFRSSPVSAEQECAAVISLQRRSQEKGCRTSSDSNFVLQAMAPKLAARQHAFGDGVTAIRGNARRAVTGESLGKQQPSQSNSFPPCDR